MDVYDAILLRRRVRSYLPANRGSCCAFGTSRAYELGGEVGRDYVAVVDSALATENLVLVACSLGLATCIVKSFAETAVSEFLNLSEHIKPELIVTVGYPKERPTSPRKLPLKDMAYQEKFGMPWEEG